MISQDNFEMYNHIVIGKDLITRSYVHDMKQYKYFQRVKRIYEEIGLGKAFFIDHIIHLFEGEEKSNRANISSSLHSAKYKGFITRLTGYTVQEPVTWIQEQLVGHDKRKEIFYFSFYNIENMQQVDETLSIHTTEKIRLTKLLLNHQIKNGRFLSLSNIDLSLLNIKNKRG